MIEINMNWIQLIAMLLGIVFPLLVALVTKRVTSSKTKGLLLASISVMAGLLAEVSTALTTGTSFDPVNWLVVTLTALVAGQTTYSAIWKPTGTTKALQRVGEPGTSA